MCPSDYTCRFAFLLCALRFGTMLYAMANIVAVRSKPPRTPVKLLVASPDGPYAKTLVDFLEGTAPEIERCHDAKGVLRLAGRHTFDIVVLDLALADQGDVNLVSFLRQRNQDCQLIILFELNMLEQALECIRHGAFFYLPKSSPPSDVALVVEKAVKMLRHRSRMDQFEQTLFEEFVGSTPAMQRVVELITKVAPTDSTVLLLGESGTGKEVFANSIHRLSRRHDMPFIAINCAALPEALLESEMFGHVKGAFTGAERDKQGLFEEAEGGTVFLDEVGDMSLVTQAKLLRVLQNGEIRPVGSSQSRRVDVRIIAATNKDLAEAVRANQFREDLYFRLNVVAIRIPPLRERMDALAVLTGRFLAHFNAKFGRHIRGLDEDAAALLKQYDYPGNVRELESIIAHAVILADTDLIRPRDLPDCVRNGPRRRLALAHEPDDEFPTLTVLEERHIRHALEICKDNQTVAARKLGISRSTLWRKMREYGINREVDAPDS